MGWWCEATGGDANYLRVFKINAKRETTKVPINPTYHPIESSANRLKHTKHQSYSWLIHLEHGQSFGSSSYSRYEGSTRGTDARHREQTFHCGTQPKQGDGEADREPPDARRFQSTKFQSKHPKTNYKDERRHTAYCEHFIWLHERKFA